MPIHDQGYRRYEGRRQAHGHTWWVIARAGLMERLRERKFLGLLLLSWLPFLVRSVQLYIAANYPQTAALLAPTPSLFREFLDQQGIFVFFITLYVGSGLIANDRRANALQIYLSKPLMRLEYIGGKLAVLMVFLITVTLVPALLLLILQAMFAGNLTLIRTNPHVIPAIVLASLARVIVASFTMLALSSLSKSTRYVAVLYTGAIFFTEAMYGVLRLVTGSSRVAWVSVGGNLNQITDAVFRQPLRYDTPVVVSALVLIGLVAVSISVLERRVRAVEIVA
jgi:ABC-2 type transport system permease protein